MRFVTWCRVRQRVRLRRWGTMHAMQKHLNELFSALVARATIDPPASSRPLFLQGQQCGWVAQDVPALLQAGPVRLAAHATGWSLVTSAQIDSEADIANGSGTGDITTAIQSHSLDLNAQLAHVAKQLHDQGRLRGWRGELLDVTDLGGRVLGAIERAAVRPLGIATRAVHLNAWTPTGQMWIAQRALDKSTDPGKWDTLVGGLVSATESDALALERESWEEAGLPAACLSASISMGEYCVRRILPEGYQVEWVGVTDVVVPNDVVPCNQDGEVVQIRTATPDEVVDMIAQNLFTLEACLAMGLSFVQRGWLAAEVMALVVRRPA
jgi:8-oxo-dGTP pyrophosphatase MutT (NUDIX family)